MHEKINLTTGVKLDKFDNYNEVIQKIETLVQEKKGVVLNYLYWVSFVKSRKNKKYAEALINSDINLIDGIGLQTYLKLVFGKKCENMNGTDFNPVLVEYFNKKKYKIALYGSDKENIKNCYNKLKEKIKTLYFFQDGYSNLDFKNIEDGSVLFVGLGTPKQELWVMENIKEIRKKKILVVTVGGYFDFVSEKYKRAPKFIRKIKLEWLYRILERPDLHFVKYLNNFYFPYFLIKDFFQVSLGKNRGFKRRG